jgi:hypothetical protein
MGKGKNLANNIYGRRSLWFGAYPVSALVTVRPDTYLLKAYVFKKSSECKEHGVWSEYWNKEFSIKVT